MVIEKNKVIHINESSFDKVIKSKLTLVDFWAEWCGPCRLQIPILDELAEVVGEKAIISKLNVDDNRVIAARYGIMSIPTLILFKNGVPVKKFVGVQPRQVLLDAINTFA